MVVERTDNGRTIYVTTEEIFSVDLNGQYIGGNYYGAYSLDYPKMLPGEFVHEKGTNKIKLFKSPSDAIQAAFELANKNLSML